MKGSKTPQNFEIDPKQNSRPKQLFPNQQRDASGIATVEILAILLLAVIAITLFNVFLTAPDLKSAGPHMVVADTIQETMRLTDPYADITGKLYPAAEVNATINARLTKTMNLLSLNLPPGQVPDVIAIVFSCGYNGIYQCTEIDSACSDPVNANCPAAAEHTVLQGMVEDYSKELSTVKDFTSPLGGREWLYIEAMAPFDNNKKVIQDLAYFGVTPLGRTDPTIRAGSPSPGPQPQCSDGIDNDGDSLIDGSDPECSDATDNNESA